MLILAFFDDPLPTTLTIATVVATAAAVTPAPIPIAVPDIPPPAPAPPAATAAFVWVMAVVAVCPWKEAVTLILKAPATLFGRTMATARPAWFVVTVRECAPLAN